MIRASDRRPLERNTLRAFVTLHLAPSGLVLHDCTYDRQGEKEWIGLPGKPQVVDGKHQLDPQTDKPLYVRVVEIPSRDARERFQTAAVDAVRRLLGVAP